MRLIRFLKTQAVKYYYVTQDLSSAHNKTACFLTDLLRLSTLLCRLCVFRVFSKFFTSLLPIYRQRKSWLQSAAERGLLEYWHYDKSRCCSLDTAFYKYYWVKYTMLWLFYLKSIKLTIIFQSCTSSYLLSSLVFEKCWLIN